MQAGLCGYPEHDETVLVRLDAIRKMAETLNGKPVYILHQEVDLDSIKQEANGYVTETWVDPEDGWLWSKFMVIDDEAHKVILQNEYKTSNAYIPTQRGEGGEHHALPYDVEILDASFTHLALVPSPRYEGAKIYTPEQYQARNTQLVNSLDSHQPTKKGFVMKFWKKEEVSDASTADFVEYTNDKGETVTKSVEEMKNALEAEAKQKELQSKKVLVNGKEMTVAELAAAYEKLNARKNRNEVDEEMDNEDDEEKENEIEPSLETEDRVNADEDDEDDADDEDEKKNSHFKTLKNAHLKNGSGAHAIMTRSAKIARGRELFSTK